MLITAIPILITCSLSNYPYQASSHSRYSTFYIETVYYTAGCRALALLQ